MASLAALQKEQEAIIKELQKAQDDFNNANQSKADYTQKMNENQLVLDELTKLSQVRKI